MVIEIPPWLDPAETLLFAAACIKSGRVKFCPPTIDKMATHPLGAALSFKADDPVDAALQGAFLAAISLIGRSMPTRRCGCAGGCASSTKSGDEGAGAIHSRTSTGASGWYV